MRTISYLSLSTRSLVSEDNSLDFLHSGRYSQQKEQIENVYLLMTLSKLGLFSNSMWIVAYL